MRNEHIPRRRDHRIAGVWRFALAAAVLVIIRIVAGCAASQRVEGGPAQHGIANLAAAATSAPAQSGAANSAQTMAPSPSAAGNPASQPAGGATPDLTMQQGAANASVQGNTGISFTSAVSIGGVVLFVLAVAVAWRALATVDRTVDRLHRSQPCEGR